MFAPPRHLQEAQLAALYRVIAEIDGGQERRASTDFRRILIQAARSRVPGVAQHEVMRCRPGTAQVAEFRAVPHLRSSTSCCTACGTRQRITRRRFQVLDSEFRDGAGKPAMASTLNL